MQRLIAAALVLALASTSTTGALGAILEQDSPEWERYWSQLRRHYNQTKTPDVAYKPIFNRSAYIGKIDPPFVTPDPDRVEVIAFVLHGNEAWITNYRLMTKWAKTLPSDAAVHYLPQKTLRQSNPHPRVQPLRAVRQNLYHTALAMGAPSGKAHHLIVRLVTGNLWTLESTQSQKRYARTLRLDQEQFQAMHEHPAVRWEGQIADWLELAQGDEGTRITRTVARNARKIIQLHYPELLIGGKYVISMTARKDARETYRMANWAIRKSLLDLESNRHWPRKADELAAWLAERDGQILSRWMQGKHQDSPSAGIVYDAKAQAIWILDRGGAVRDVATLTYDENDGTHFVYERDGQEHYFDIWRLARQYVGWKSTDENKAPQRHAAFLLAEHLVDRADPIALEANGQAWNVTFEATGHGTIARTGETLPGTWRLNGNQIEVRLQHGEQRTWEWIQVAEAAGFEMPRESMWPWNYLQRLGATQPRPGQPKTTRASTPAPRTTHVMKTPKTDAAKLLVEAALQKARAAAERLHRGPDER